MKRIFLSFWLLCILLIPVKSQNLIARHSAGTVTFYTTLVSAYTACVSDDTLYLPGGAFETPSQFVKKLHIIGAGAIIDSTTTTGNTKLYSTGTEIKINTGAAYSTFEGIYFDDAVTLGSTPAGDDNLHDIIFTSCYFTTELKFGTINPTPIYNISTINCLLNAVLTAQKAVNCSYFNTSFQASAGTSKNSVYKNCVFTQPVRYNESCSFENCILAFSGEGAGLYDTYCTYKNCVIAYCCSGPTNTFIDNYSCYPIFQATGYYQLNTGCAGKNGGTDGSDVGIYGGFFKWKVGMIPSNPHISSKVIPDASNSDGTLDVNIKVSAQDQ